MYVLICCSKYTNLVYTINRDTKQVNLKRELYCCEGDFLYYFSGENFAKYIYNNSITKRKILILNK